MVQGIASQILSETPSQPTAPVNATAEESNTVTQPASDQGNELDPRFQILTKMERKVKEAEAKHREREKEWEQKAKRLSELEELDGLFEQNPLEALKKRKGWGVQEFNEYALQNSTDEDLDPVAKITKNFTTKMEEMNKTWEEKLQAAIKAKEDEINQRDQESQVIQFKGNLKSFLAENKDSYEFIHAEGEAAMEEVFSLIKQDIEKQLESGAEESQLKIMDMKDAADRVEAFLDKQYSKYLSLNKVKSKFSDGNDRLVQFVTKSKEEPTTLNSSFSPKSKPQDQLSAEERKQAAVAFMRSQKT